MDVIESLYWCVAQLKQQGRLANRVMQKYALTAIENALERFQNFMSLSRYLMIKYLLLKGHTEASLIRRLGTSYRSMAGGLDWSSSPEDPEDHEDLARILNIDLNAHMEASLLDEETLLGSPSMPTDDTVLNEVVVDPVVNPAEGPSIFVRADALRLVEAIWDNVGDDQELGSHARVLLTDASESFKKLVARRSSLALQSVILEPFSPLPDSDGTLRRKPDFLETLFTENWSRRESIKRPNDTIRPVEVPEFVPKPQHRESMQ
ncbi:hypothetical protein R1sor_026532 [Riccia sorocarpa]|uniref:Uncharacterized protein n=1 Tax=Riccia sorocarpa TaxID=122646 RepID=A0ABD3GFR2_9MARC